MKKKFWVVNRGGSAVKYGVVGVAGNRTCNTMLKYALTQTILLYCLKCQLSTLLIYIVALKVLPHQYQMSRSPRCEAKYIRTHKIRHKYEENFSKNNS